MQRYNDVPEPINTEALSHFKTFSYLQWWLWLTVLSSLAMGTLACGLFDTSSNRLIIHARLPTLTPTVTLAPETGQILEKGAVASPSSLLVSTRMPILTPALTPAGAELISTANADQAISELPLLTPSVVLNVRAGPGVDYAVVGQLAQGQSTKIIGQNPEGTWWQVAYPPDSDNPAWVSADIQYSIVSNVDGVPIAQIPVQPTATAVPVQPTATTTPTSTSIATIQPTESPEATSTLTIRPLARPTTPPQDRPTLPVPAGMRPSVD
jgi:uncharacterized protein YraI